MQSESKVENRERTGNQRKTGEKGATVHPLLNSTDTDLYRSCGTGTVFFFTCLRLLYAAGKVSREQYVV